MPENENGDGVRGDVVTCLVLLCPLRLSSDFVLQCALSWSFAFAIEKYLVKYLELDCWGGLSAASTSYKSHPVRQRCRVQPVRSTDEAAVSAGGRVNTALSVNHVLEPKGGMT